MSESGNDSQQSAESLSEELYFYCASESLSEDGLREIIQRHGLPPTRDNNNPHVNNFDFFLEACANERVTEGIIQCLLEYFPAASSTINDIGLVPLHVVCNNTNVTRSMVELLIDAAPNSVRSVDEDGWMPLHHFCSCNKVDGVIQILNLLVEKYPEALRHVDNNLGFLPIHIASGASSPEYCRVLIEAYPGSERITDPAGNLPLGIACTNNTVATVEYLYELYPDAINHTTTDGHYPIHYAITGTNHRDSPIAAVDIVQFLLGCDPIVKLQKFGEVMSLLFCACQGAYNDSNIHAALEMIKVIYDAHPEAIEDSTIASHIHEYHQQVKTFINGELVYARQAKDRRQMTTPDHNRQLPLHTALQNNVRLGSIKLLVKGNPSAIRTFDRSGVIPLHVACQHHDSASVVQYLVGLDTTILDAVDREGNTALHLACLGAKYNTIAMLLEKYGAVSVSKWNAQKKLPIDLLWESNAVEDRESIEYTESVFRLLRTYPETVMDYFVDMNKQTKAGGCSPLNEKKRKWQMK